MSAQPKVQLNPVEKIINKQKAKLEEKVIDEDGKVYELKLPDPIDEFDLSAALGRDHSTNVGLLIQATPLLYIQSIDSVRFEFAGSYNGIRAALKVVGRNGMRAVNAAVQKFLISENVDTQERR